MFTDLLKLKSGTDVRGVALESDKGPVILTDENVEAIVSSFLSYVAKNTGKTCVKVAIGHDTRLSSPRIYEACKRAILSCGCEVVLCGQCSTPSLFMILQKSDLRIDGSIMVTASHLPYDKNGLKFFMPSGGLEEGDIDEVLEGAMVRRHVKGDSPKEMSLNFMDEYAKGLADMVRISTGKEKPLDGVHIVVDASGGCGSFYVDKVLKPLGANTEGSINLQPDGHFTSHAPNPEDGKAIATLKEAVLKAKADFGVIFDTDVDRAACVDKDGEEINRNRLIALISAILLKEKPGTIVTDSVASDHLTEFILSLGGKHIRYKRGYKNVIDKCIDLNSKGIYSPLAIETSGHAALKENYYLDDGAYLITRILSTFSKNKDISSLISGLKNPAEEKEIRLSFNEESVSFKDEGLALIDELKLIADEIDGVTLDKTNYEGLRIRFDKSCGNGYIQIRQSVHDPVLPINFESDDIGGIAQMAKTLQLLIGGYDFLDMTPLEELAQNE